MYTEQIDGWSSCARSVLVFVVRSTFGSRAEIVSSVLFSFDEGKFVRFQNFEQLKICCRTNAEQRSVTVRFMFALHSLGTLYNVRFSFFVVIFIPHLFGACSALA